MENKRILVVDDLEENLFLINQILKSFFPDNEIITTDNAKEAFQLCVEKLPHLVITDWDMPKMSGIELIKHLKNHHATQNIPIIIATGIMTDSEHLKEALEKGAIDYIRKPFDEVELFARSRAALELTNYYHKSIENKNYELALRATNTVQNRNFILKMMKKIEVVKNQTDNENILNLINDLMEDLKQQKHANSWKDFDKSFRTTHNDYLKQLIQKHPTISNSELKLCNLIYLGMSCKKIALTLNQTEQSVRVSRSRIRKKFDLPAEQSLELYLKQI